MAQFQRLYCLRYDEAELINLPGADYFRILVSIVRKKNKKPRKSGTSFLRKQKG
jgi:hypothetical protein